MVSKPQGYAHAALAASVAVWNSYVPDLVRDFYQVTANPLDVKFNAAHTLSRDAAEIALGKFNTPNWENSRNLLVQWTGYDPITDWTWLAKGLSSPLLKSRLNEILKVRHSFAHGFAIPSYSWTTASSGEVRLTAASVKVTKSLFVHLVRKTDRGLRKHIRATYGSTGSW